MSEVGYAITTAVVLAFVLVFGFSPFVWALFKWNCYWFPTAAGCLYP